MYQNNIFSFSIPPPILTSTSCGTKSESEALSFTVQTGSQSFFFQHKPEPGLSKFLETAPGYDIPFISWMRKLPPNALPCCDRVNYEWNQ